MVNLATALDNSLKTKYPIRISKDEFSYRIKKQLRCANNLQDVQTGLIKLLNEMRSPTAIERIGFVSGIMNSDSDNITRNAALVQHYTDILRVTIPFPVFCGVDVIYDELRSKLTESTEIPQAKWHDFWRNVIRSGYITDLFMTPRWINSIGSKEEYHTATEMNLNIKYVYNARNSKENRNDNYTLVITNSPDLNFL